MSTCSQTNIPTLTVVGESCNGYYPPTRCIIHQPAIPFLGILAGETLQNIIAEITINLYNQSTRIANLETQIGILESQIESCCE